jgi:DMSO/TMAO reductase YedYZ heme-binding membrane subunit
MNDHSTKHAAPQIIATAIVVGLAYAVVRYHIAGPVPWKDLPFFILNKGVSLSAFILLACNFGFGPLENIGVRIPASWLGARKAIGMTGFLLVLVHVLVSFMLFKPEIYAQFFENDGTVTLQGGISMLAGVLGFVFLWAYNLSFQTFLREDESFIQFITSRRTMLFALLFGGVHVFFMGYEGWLNPAGWHGGLPPISLVAFAFFVAAYVVNLFGRR